MSGELVTYRTRLLIETVDNPRSRCRLSDSLSLRVGEVGQNTDSFCSRREGPLQTGTRSETEDQRTRAKSRNEGEMVLNKSTKMKAVQFIFANDA